MQKFVKPIQIFYFGPLANSKPAVNFTGYVNIFICLFLFICCFVCSYICCCQKVSVVHRHFLTMYMR